MRVQYTVIFPYSMSRMFLLQHTCIAVGCLTEVGTANEPDYISDNISRLSVQNASLYSNFTASPLIPLITWPTTTQTGPAPSAVIMRVNLIPHPGHVQRHHLAHASVASVEVQRAFRPVSHHDIHLSYPYSVCIHSGGSSGRRFGTLGDDSDDGDDEPQNYFAGGERR